MSERIYRAMNENKETPHLNNHEIVLELYELNKKVDDLQKAVTVLLSDSKSEKE